MLLWCARACACADGRRALAPQLRERELRKSVTAQFKTKLDYIATLEAQHRAQEQVQVLEALRARMLEAVKDPKFQETLLKKCVADIEAMAPAK